MGLMFMCPHECDMALCCITVNNVAPSLSLVGHPWNTGFVLDQEGPSL